MRPIIAITETLDENCADWLAQRADVQWAKVDQDGKPAQSLQNLLPQIQGLVVRTYTQVDDQLLQQAPNLKVIGRAGVGLDNIDLNACRQRNIPVVYTPDANTQAVVEYVLGLMLDAFRPRTNLPSDATPTQFHQLRKTQVGQQLDQLTLGILGFGRIGKRLGRVAHALGVNLKVCDILPEVQGRKAVNYPYQFVDHQTLYRQSHIISIHVDGRPENRHLISHNALREMRDDVLLINAARGMIVDPDALAQWAQRVQPAGGRAVLDVHDPEPPTNHNPLRNLPNVRLLPHLASRTQTAMQNMSWVVRDVWAVLDGAKPDYPAW